MAAISSMKITLLIVFSKLVHFNDLGIKSYSFDHAESEFRPPEIKKSLIYKILDKELKYIMLVSMKCSLDLRQK